MKTFNRSSPWWTSLNVSCYCSLFAVVVQCSLLVWSQQIAQRSLIDGDHSSAHWFDCWFYFTILIHTDFLRALQFLLLFVNSCSAMIRLFVAILHVNCCCLFNIWTKRVQVTFICTRSSPFTVFFIIASPVLYCIPPCLRLRSNFHLENRSAKCQNSVKVKHSSANNTWPVIWCAKHSLRFVVIHSGSALFEWKMCQTDRRADWHGTTDSSTSIRRKYDWLLMKLAIAIFNALYYCFFFCRFYFPFLLFFWLCNCHFSALDLLHLFFANNSL